MTNAHLVPMSKLGAIGLASALLGSLTIGQNSNVAPALDLLDDLRLSGGTLGEYQLLESFDGRMLIAFEHPDQALYIDLAPHSVRAENFEVRYQLDDGSWMVADSQPVQTYRGTVLGEPDSYVAASILADGLHARIQLSGNREFWIEPVLHQTGLAEAHVLYQTEQVMDSGSTCATGAASNMPAPRSFAPSSSSSGMTLSTVGNNMNLAASTVAELACDADYEYFQNWGSVSAVQSRIESVINTTNLQYERDVDITHAITTILVRSSSNDPYSKKRADQLLYQFRDEWNANQSGIQRDVAELFTAKTLAGSTIGIAWLGQVCNLDLAYSVVQSDFNNNFASATDLSAHELGHNWDANHCSCTTYTMNAYITSSNRFNPSGTIPAITSYRDAQSCFGAVDPPEDPVSISVGSIGTGTQNAGQGKKNGTATVSIETDTGSAAAGASVTGTFSGDYNESVAGVTDGSGNVTFVTSATQKGGISFTFCVDSVSGSLPYVPADNAMNCDSF
ncbi:MAG: hypothetical protein ACI8X5_003782 [Planctomycetota bacterium]|jgi:hypothetical protein